jgi:hypothetical protein
MKKKVKQNSTSSVYEKASQVYLDTKVYRYGLAIDFIRI